jgi:hypothetical protein
VVTGTPVVISAPQILISSPIDALSQVRACGCTSACSAQTAARSLAWARPSSPSPKTASRWTLQLAEEQIGLTAQYRADRGGMAQPEPGVHNPLRWEDASNWRSRSPALANGDDQVGLLGLDAGGQLVPTTTLTTDPNVIFGALADLRAVRGVTTCTTACAPADLLATAAPSTDPLVVRRKILVIFTDGLDTTSAVHRHRRAQPRARARRDAVHDQL